MVDTFYHWSHRTRRKSIEHRGLLPHQWSRDRLWRPPHICLAPTPLVGWALSGGMNYPVDNTLWDLWEVDVSEQTGFEELYYDTGALKEIRVYERIFKRNVHWIAERDNTNK